MRYSITKKLNLLLGLFFLLANLWLLFVLPFLLHKSFWWILPALMIVLLSNTYWSLIHEGIHFLFHPNKKSNDIISRILSIVFGCSFNVLRIGHLTHHRHNRSDHDRPEVFETSKHRWLPKTLHYYWFLTNGLYFVELFIPFASFLPQKTLLNLIKSNGDKAADATVINHLYKQISQKSLLNKIRLDTSFVLILYGISFYLYGSFFIILLLILLGRGLLISAADNLPHYGTPIDDKYYAFNLTTPKWLAFILLNFNYHRIHHKAPNVPWYALPKEFAHRNDSMDMSYFFQWRQQFKGLISIEQLKPKLNDLNGE